MHTEKDTAKFILWYLWRKQKRTSAELLKGQHERDSSINDFSNNLK